MDKLANILKQAGLRLTESRKEVFQALKQSPVPLTITEIIKACPNTNRTSIYRILEMFHQIHIIDTVHISWKIHYELAEPFVTHHHHLYCTRCKNAIPIVSKELEQLVSRIEHQYNFQVFHHYFEIEGLCSDCRTVSPQAPHPKRRAE